MINIINAQGKFAASISGEMVGNLCGIDMPTMQGPGRAGRKSGVNGAITDGHPAVSLASDLAFCKTSVNITGSECGDGFYIQKFWRCGGVKRGNYGTS